MVAQNRDLKVVILGAELTGKTALAKKYIHSTFSEDYSPSFEQQNTKHVSVDGQIHTLRLFPTEPSGENHLCQIGQAFILLYAINNRESFQYIRHQHNQLKEAKGTSLASTPVFLVGTKVDLEAERQVSLQEARQLAIELRCQKLFEISVRNQTEEIDDLFTKLIRQHQSFEQEILTAQSVMNSSPSTPAPMSSSNNDSPSRRGSVLDRLKFGSLKRKASLQSLVRKKSGSFSESVMSLTSAKQSRENVRSIPYGSSNTQSESNRTSTSTSNSNGNSNSYVRSYNNGTTPRRPVAASPYRLDVNTSAWRDTIKWPTEIIPEEDLK